MAICDLSSSNPNVLFELALRQAFDKPVALIQETGTRQIFDIAPLRYTEYRKERVYHEVIEDQARISTTVIETADAHKTGKGVNSIVKLLALSQAAKLPDASQDQNADLQRIVLAEVGQLRAEFRSAVKSLQTTNLNSDEGAPLVMRRYRDILASNLERMEMMLANSPDEFRGHLHPEFEMTLNDSRRIQREAMTLASSQRDRDFLMEMDLRLDRFQAQMIRAYERMTIDRNKSDRLKPKG